MHYLYIIYSSSLDKFYTGETTDVQERLLKHNEHAYQKAFTKAADDWTIKLQKKCENKSDAVYLEQFIKRMKSKKFILKIIQNPEILDDILSKK